MSEFRIIDTNEILSDGVVLTSSGDSANFPKENVLNSIRTKVWRSNNQFIINSSNDKIDFDEGGGELTATITTAVYNGPDDLRNEIKTQLETAGADTYSVSFSQINGTWSIQNTTGPTFSLLWDTGTNTASSIGAAIGYDVSSDDTGSLTYNSDFSAIHTQERLQFDLLTATDIDSFVMVFDPIDGSKFTSSASVRLLANSVDAWGAPPLNIALTYDETYKTFSHFFSTPETYRYWRISIIDPNNTNVNIEISKVVLGKATQLSQMPQIGFTDALTDQSEIFKTKYGHKYADEYPDARGMTFQYTHLPKADVELLQTIFRQHGNHQVLTIALDPLATLFDKDRFILYGCFDGDLEMKNTFNEFFDTELSFIEAF